MAVHAFNPSTREVTADESEFQGGAGPKRLHVLWATQL